MDIFNNRYCPLSGSEKLGQLLILFLSDSIVHVIISFRHDSISLVARQQVYSLFPRSHKKVSPQKCIVKSMLLFTHLCGRQPSLEIASLWF